MIRRLSASLMVLVTVCVGLRQASAETYLRHVNGREVIVHTNAAPVILHRVVPPYLGKHVTERQLKVGRLPPGTRK